MPGRFDELLERLAIANKQNPQEIARFFNIRPGEMKSLANFEKKADEMKPSKRYVRDCRAWQESGDNAMMMYHKLGISLKILEEKHT